jgi:secretion/DNA translocation related TadE-like protein
VLVFVTAVCVAVAAIVLAHRRAQVAADLGALAGASALQRGGDACAAAERIVLRQDARLTGCVVEGSDVVVATGVPVAVPLGGAELPARARAGPVGG